MIGLNCVDIVNFVKKYPLEDSDQRCNNQTWERGGNASNNASVLADLGAEVEYFGTLANDHLLTFFQDDMNSRGITSNHCPIMNCCKSPASVVLCSEETGSRTIVHHNGNLPELTIQQFEENIALENYSWVHFEGRNETQLPKMLQRIQAFNEQRKDNSTASNGSKLNYQTKILPVSVEVEKTREALGTLLPFADVVFIGKDFSIMRGAKDGMDAARLFAKELPNGILIIYPWGEDGATFAFAGDPETAKHVQAYPPNKIIDSLGAGDTFCASVIYALNKKFDPETSVRFGCQVAGAKLSLVGFRKIIDAIQGTPECDLILKK